jgi:YVTN family beta-propeller protein
MRITMAILTGCIKLIMNTIMGAKATRTYIISLSFFFIFLISGCASVEEQEQQQQKTFDPNQGQITLFLNGPEKASLDITFDVSAVNLVSEDGRVRQVTDVPRKINSLDIKGRQILIGEATLPEGKYRKVQLIVSQASIRKEDSTARLALPEDGIEIAIDAKVIRNQNTPLFINWNPDTSVKDGYLFQPALPVKGQQTELSALLVYVTNEGSDNVSVINRKSGEVVATVMVGKNPKGIASSSERKDARVYVANSGSDSISVIDPNTNKVESEIPVRFGKEPIGIAVTNVIPNREFVIATNYRTNSVSFFDADTFEETTSIDVGRGPTDVTVDPSEDTFFSSRHFSPDEINLLESYRRKFFNVYVVNENSRDVSVLKMNVQTMELEEVLTVSVDWRPIALELDYARGKLYVANYGSDKLSVIDILGIVKGDLDGAVSTINDVGTFITGIVADPAFERLYLLKEVPGQILILRPSFSDLNVLEAAMPPVMGIIPVGERPRSLELDPEIRMLYVVNRGSDNITVIDKTTRKVTGLIPVGSRPYGIAFFSR